LKDLHGPRRLQIGCTRDEERGLAVATRYGVGATPPLGAAVSAGLDRQPLGGRGRQVPATAVGRGGDGPPPPGCGGSGSHV